MARRVFIIGVAGFLGSHLADALILRGFRVSGIDNLLGGCIDNVPLGVDFRVADCNDRSAYSDMLVDTEVVFHCAALAHEGLSVFSPHLINTHGSNASAAALSVAISKGVKRFVFCSSMARYGANPVPFTEEQEPHPLDPYGISKYASELLLRALSREHGMEFNIAVPHNIIGPRQRYDDPYRNVASIMISRMLGGQQPIIYGDGSQTRCFSFVADVVPSLILLGMDPHVRAEVVNLGPDEQVVTVCELAKTIAALLDFELKPIFACERPLEVKAAYCSSAKARSVLGYRTTYTLDQGLREMIAWIRGKGAKRFRYSYEIEITNSRTPKTWTEQLI